MISDMSWSVNFFFSLFYCVQLCLQFDHEEIYARKTFTIIQFIYQNNCSPIATFHAFLAIAQVFLHCWHCVYTMLSCKCFCRYTSCTFIWSPGMDAVRIRIRLGCWRWFPYPKELRPVPCPQWHRRCSAPTLAHSFRSDGRENSSEAS